MSYYPDFIEAVDSGYSLVWILTGHIEYTARATLLPVIYAYCNSETADSTLSITDLGSIVVGYLTSFSSGNGAEMECTILSTSTAPYTIS